jgi:dTDP-4-dehydrorhamnose reductase
MTAPASDRLELWGGVECTVHRVGDRFGDQLQRSGHDVRIDDLERFAQLGLTTLRYPILWERTADASATKFNWEWADARMARLRALGIEPVVGLVHHGSGPAGISLLDRSYSDGLERYAAAVARRFPWVQLFTPVNEPNTTARFSALYGHWHPHARDGASFARAFLEQCRGVVHAMRAIRRIIPDARLVQTEDLGRTHSTPQLGYQAEFENERRWLTWDLLCGRLVPGCPMWSYFRWLGIDRDELAWFLDHPCPPDIIGINHYLTSERFLDDRTELYPPEARGGNCRDAYADVEAVRALAAGADGPERLLREAWERYRLPVAVTEVHNGCTREEQLRWILEVWDAATRLRAQDVDVRAVTIWALLGAFDWNTLLSCERGHYEPGAFDLRSPAPRPTAIARIIRQLASGIRPLHPLFEENGWWRRPERLIFGLAYETEPQAPRPAPINRNPQLAAAAPVLITGGRGTLGSAFARICESRAIPYRLLTRDELDIANRDAAAAIVRALRPWAVINAAGYVRVDDAEGDEARCLRENAEGPALLAEICAERGVRFVAFSSDLVFSGRTKTPYFETDAPSPLNVYGRSKLEAEQRIAAVNPSALVIRTSAFFGPWDAYNFATCCLRNIAAGRVFHAPAAIVSPTYVPDLAHTTLDLLIDDESGLWHLANRGAISWLDFARLVARAADLDSSLVRVASERQLGWRAPRPRYSALGSRRGSMMPPLEDAVARYAADCDVAASAARLVAIG